MMMHKHTTSAFRQQEILRYIIDIGSSLRLPMDIDTLLNRVTEASCKALGFRYSVLYLIDEHSSMFRARAFSGIGSQERAYLREHSVPEDVITRLTCDDYRLSNSYFIPAGAPLWEDGYVVSFFVVGEEDAYEVQSPYSHREYLSPFNWQAEDMLVVPLKSSDNTLLGFLTPDAPLDKRRPTIETMELLELFANQAAVIIEGARLYDETRRVGEERAALIEIGRALSAPEAQRDLQTVYQTIYEQVRRVMPAEAFYISRYYPDSNTLFMEYLIDKDILYSPMDLKTIMPAMQHLLFYEQVGYLFSTLREFNEAVNKDYPDTDKFLIGGSEPTEAFLFVPIRYGDTVLGLMSAQSYRPYAYSQRHLELLREISVQAGIAIANAQLTIDLREAVKLAQDSEKLKNHFLMTASHELRTPLTAIQGYLELLGTFYDTLDEPSKRRFISNARRACEELVILLSSVMDTSRVDHERIALNCSSVELMPVVRSILDILEPAIARENRSVQLDIPGDMRVWGDELRLRQILLNLANNALKYTPPASAIAISAEHIEARSLNQRLATMKLPEYAQSDTMFALIGVRDWGPGISARDQHRLFTKFLRLEGAINSLQRGSGLGLYLCRQLTEAMNGKIWVESSGIAGEGSTFFIALPQTAN